MNSRVILRSSRHHPSSTTTSALPTQPRQILRSSVSQSLVHRLLHPPRAGKTSPSVQFQNSFLFASLGRQAGTSGKGFSSTAGRRDSGKKSDGNGVEADNKGWYEGKDFREAKERDEKTGLKHSMSKGKESSKPHSDSKKQKGNENPIFQHREPSVIHKGKLQSTPSRLFKLLLPLSGLLVNNPDPPAESLAILIHPQQPLSYLERLIQAELAPLTSSGTPRPPTVAFKAVDLDNTLLSAHRAAKDHDLELLTKDPNREGIVRWSTSTEIGDFVRDAALTKEFIIEIEGIPDVPVSVPSFSERTYILRQRLKETTREMMKLQVLKGECDRMAKMEGKRIALGGFAGLTSWWAVVYWLTFRTSYGWDIMEPVTYLVGLTAAMASYIFFLYSKREVSYRSVLNATVSKRQLKLYQSRGFDLDRWEELVEDGKVLRKEIRTIAEQYGEVWDEGSEVGDEKVRRVLKDGKEKKEKKESTEEGREGEQGERKGKEKGST